MPQSPHGRQEAAQAVIDMQRWRDINSDQLADQLTPFFDHEWCVDAVVKALLARPDGTAQPEVHTSRRVDEVIYKLRCWRGDGGQPLRPPVEGDSSTEAPQNTLSQPSDARTAAALHDRRWPRSVVPETSDQRLEAVKSLREARRWNKEIEDNQLLDMVAPFFDADWSVECLSHAFDTSALTGKPSPLDSERGRGLSEQVANRLDGWKTSRGKPKSPPKRTQSYEAWHKKLDNQNKFDVRERKTSRSKRQLEALQQAREDTQRRQRRRAQDRVAEARRQDKKWRDNMDALFKLAPEDTDVDIPIPTPQTRHERMIEGIFYLEATDPQLLSWLRSLIEMEPENITREAAQVTRTRMRDARTRASLAALEQMSTPTEELSTTARTLAEYAIGAPDVSAGNEVRDMWLVLRSAIRSHDRRSGPNKR